MTDQIVLTIPEDISARARRIAETTEQPVEQVLLELLQTLSTPQPILPPKEQAELDSLVERADRLMLRKAEAASILTQRGYPVTQKDFKPTHD
jgi:hypothetical protein